jgi:hypothetical protein
MTNNRNIAIAAAAAVGGVAAVYLLVSARGRAPAAPADSTEGRIAEDADAATAVAKAAELRQDANHFVSRGEYNAALARYQAGLDALQLALSPALLRRHPAQHAAAALQAQTILSNVVLVLGRNMQFAECVAAATELLGQDGLAAELRPKVLYRRAMAHKALKAPAAAAGDLEEASRLTDAANADVERELRALRA